jgi:hypothetical protein
VEDIVHQSPPKALCGGKITHIAAAVKSVDDDAAT